MAKKISQGPLAVHPLTRVSKFDGWTAKREDEAFLFDPEYPSGSKVRQYITMSKASPGAPMLVGCSADSAMQIYVAASAKQAGVPGIVYTAKRKERTAATEYALRLGAEVVEVPCGYLSVLRARARDRAKELGSCVRWDVRAALNDTMLQCKNLPKSAKRILVPTGSGLTASGVLAGVARYFKNPQPEVLLIAVSEMADEESIRANAEKLTNHKIGQFSFVRAPGKYGDWKAAKLPDGTALDPYYAAKAFPYIGPGDCLWVSGVRPLSAMPEACRKALEAI